MDREGRIVVAACIATFIGLSLVYAFAASWRDVIARAFDHAVWIGLIAFLVVHGNSVRSLLTGLQLDRATLRQIDVNLENLRLQQEQIRQNIRLMELQHADLERKLNVVQVVRPGIVVRPERVTVRPEPRRVDWAEPE